MKFEEFKAKFNSILSKPDDLDQAKEVIGEMKGIFEKFDEAKKTIDEQDKKIRDLQDTNMRLYLAQTAEPEEEEEIEEEEKEKSFEDILNDIEKEEKKNA